MTRIAVINSSVRDGRYGKVVADWFLTRTTGFEVDVIDLVDVDLPLNLNAHGAEPSDRAAAALQSVAPVLAAAEAFVIVTPEYNHSYGAAIKNLIDWNYTPWQAKPVGFVSYGGVSGGLRAVEHLRQVFAELHAVTVRDCVSFSGIYGQFEEDGSPKDAATVNGAAKILLDQLDWWAVSLAEARAKRPYVS